VVAAIEAAEVTATVTEFGFIDENLGAFGNSIFLSVVGLQHRCS